MDIRAFSDDQTESWNAYVQNHAQGSFFHRTEWKNILEEGLGFKPLYIAAFEENNICGILPLALVKRPLFGPVLLSTPMCVYGGILADNDETQQALEEYAIQKAEELGVQHLELRNAHETKSDLLTSNNFYSFKKELSSNHEENLKSIPRKQRAEVRKGISANLTSNVSQDIDLFYKIYATSVRNLGTPIFSKKYLKSLIQYFPDHCEITTIYADGKPVSSVLSFYDQGQVLPYYGGGLPSARNCSAYAFMYWDVMCQAVKKGYKIFDYGRSMKGTGAYAFKKAWGFEPKNLPYQYHLVKAKSLPDMNAESPTNKLIMSAWKHCPLPVANNIGPILYPVVA